MALALLTAAGVGFFLARWVDGVPDATAHRERIVRWAREVEVDPLLVEAIVLAESGGDPLAVSQAGAVGLMQLVPATARRRAKELGRPDFDLRDPDDNLCLGTYHLSRLIERFGRRIPLAVAAYNAGAGRAALWAEAAPHLSSEDLIDTLAYDETRLYVLRVGSFRQELSR
jgi:soluble lytic murein transglycosylase